MNAVSGHNSKNKHKISYVEGLMVTRAISNSNSLPCWKPIRDIEFAILNFANLTKNSKLCNLKNDVEGN